MVGEPTTAQDAAQLAREDPFQFQAWALGLVGARTAESNKRGADRGIDGRLYFHDEPNGKTKQIVLSVKAGHTGPAHIRDLRGVVDREKAQIGVLITLQEPTQPMRSEAAGAGFYTSPWGDHPRFQILTVRELLAGKDINFPRGANVVTFKKAPKIGDVPATTLALPFEHDGRPITRRPEDSPPSQQEAVAGPAEDRPRRRRTVVS